VAGVAGATAASVAGAAAAAAKYKNLAEIIYISNTKQRDL